MAGYRALAMTQEQFCGLMRGKHPGYEVVKNPLPKDAKVVNMRIHQETGEMEFCIYSDTYEWVKPGQSVPYAPVPMYAPLKEPT